MDYPISSSIATAVVTVVNEDVVIGPVKGRRCLAP